MSKKTKIDEDINYLIFISSNFDPRSKIGVGCKLIMTTEDCSALQKKVDHKVSVQIKNFKDVNANRIQLETAIWALEELDIKIKTPVLSVCSDFNTTRDLLDRRSKLEKSNYSGFKEGSTLANADLYKQFFKLHDRLNFEMLWLGKPLSEADIPAIRSLFAEVQEQSRRALNEELKAQNQIAEKWF